jgi:predicted nucleic acid-binding protein
LLSIVACLYPPGEQTLQAVSVLRSDPAWAAPVLWRSELRSVLMGCLRRGGLVLDQAMRIQGEAEDLMSGSEYHVDSDAVPRLAESSGCSTYDCEYVALAKELRVRLVTRNKQVLGALPETSSALA